MRKELVYGFAGLALGCLITFLYCKNLTPANIKKSSIEIKLPGQNAGGVKIDVEGDGVDYEKVLAAIFSNDFLKNGALGWLAKNQEIYPIASADVATAISTKLCDPIPPLPLSAKMEKGRECAQKPTAVSLRELAYKHKPPFHYVGLEGSLGIPGNIADRPSKGRASVCRDGDFFGRHVRVVNPVNGALVDVDATGSYICTPPITFPDIQLGTEDAATLFGSRPIMKSESVVIVPLQ